MKMKRNYNHNLLEYWGFPSASNHRPPMMKSEFLEEIRGGYHKTAFKLLTVIVGVAFPHQKNAHDLFNLSFLVFDHLNKYLINDNCNKFCKSQP
jgi:hypothetical protein